MFYKIIFFCLFPLAVFAQNVETETIYEPTALGFWANGEYVFEKGNFAFLETRFQAYSDRKTIDVQVGYEMPIFTKWSLGVAGRGVWFKDVNWKSGRIYAVHDGKIRKIDFLKIISAEYLDEGYQKIWRGRVQGAISYTFDLPKGKFRPTLSFELFKDFSTANPTVKTRFFSRSEWRLEMAYWFKPNASISLFYLHPSNYYWTLAVYNAQNKIVRPERNLDIVSPTFGVRVHYYLPQKATEQEKKLRNLGW